MPGAPRRKAILVALGESGRMLHLGKSSKATLGEARSVLMKAKNKKLTLGQAR